MDQHQFDILIQELHICKKEIVDKLEEIRCGNVDIENAVQKLIKLQPPPKSLLDDWFR